MNERNKKKSRNEERAKCVLQIAKFITERNEAMSGSISFLTNY